TMQKLWQLFRAQGWDKQEPDPQYKKEEPQRYQRYVYRALAEDVIGESKAAELLGKALSALHSSRHMARTDDSAHQ
ncbi:MAG: transcriptional regulator, partial [Nitrososphaerales archaeon]